MSVGALAVIQQVLYGDRGGVVPEDLRLEMGFYKIILITLSICQADTRCLHLKACL